MEQETPRAPELPQPLRAVASHLSRLPGAGHVGRVAGIALDTLGAVSPRGRRIAVYTGAGVLGVAGLVEWPVALTGAAVAWLTRPRDDKETADGTRHTPAEDEAWAAATREGVVPPAGGATGHGDTHQDRDTGPGDRLTPTRHHPASRVQPAKVGDEGTASALKKVAAATGHDDDGAGRPGPTRPAARRND
ncbi:hypothetical protein [Streptomyces sp. HNS054]|uniref:hypothetical protein n=1 Tax=Streptomyces sp. HNS054 TaxID=1662446 RepID=UPI000AB2B73C|nr:hypothetical protein [Streptomyces sp. HNS054]WPW17641.1 hypothetical protein UBV09_02515 [Streptomyces griseoincarnatus]